MQFLIITDDAGVDTESAFVDLEMNERWIAKGKESGHIESIYSLAGAHGVAMVVNVDSPEGLDELMASRPACPEQSIKVMALADWGRANDTLRASYKKRLAAMK